MTNISQWITDNPFKLVIILTIVFMTFMFKEDMRAVRHNKKINKIKNKKNGQTNILD
jgi:hypothetical protein